MKKINSKILSIPPYISTSWKNINTLYTREEKGTRNLIIALQNGTVIEVPNMEDDSIEQVFIAHEKFLEHNEPHQSDSLKKFDPLKEANMSFSLGVPFRLEGNDGMDPFTSMFQHNPEQSNAPDLPPEILKKIAAIFKALGIDMGQMNIPKAEPHCNCMYCQLARTLQKGEKKNAMNEEEQITDEDLKFREWDIKQEGEKLYLVTNPLDQNEHYQVYLGHPIGCTCGQKNCEHIRTVLNS